MFQFRCCVQATLLLCLTYQIAQCQSYQFQKLPPSPVVPRCEQSEQFLLSLQRMPAVTAFQVLTMPLVTGQFPVHVQELREHLLHYIRSGILKIHFLIRDLAKLKHLDRYDLMIALLFRIQSTYPEVSNEIRKLVTHLLLKKYFGIVTTNFDQSRPRYPFYLTTPNHGAGFGNYDFGTSRPITERGSSIIGGSNFGSSGSIIKGGSGIWPIKSDRFGGVLNSDSSNFDGSSSIIEGGRSLDFQTHQIEDLIATDANTAVNTRPNQVGSSVGSFLTNVGSFGGYDSSLTDSGSSSFITGRDSSSLQFGDVVGSAFTNNNNGYGLVGSGSGFVGGGSSSSTNVGNFNGFRTDGASGVVGGRSRSPINRFGTSGISGVVGSGTSTLTNVGGFNNFGTADGFGLVGRNADFLGNRFGLIRAGSSSSTNVGGFTKFETDGSSELVGGDFSFVGSGSGLVDSGSNSLITSIAPGSLVVGGGSVNGGALRQECKCQSSLIKYLIEKLLALERRQKQLQVPEHRIISYNSVIPQILGLIPQPRYPYEIEIFNVFRSFLMSSQAESLFVGVDFSSFQDRYRLLQFIIQKCLNSTFNEKVKEAFWFYSYLKESLQINFFVANLVQLVPKPTTSYELQYYQTIIGFLRSREIYSYLTGLEISSSTSLQEVYSLVLRRLVSSNLVSMKIRTAVNYYYSQTHFDKLNINIGELLTLLPQPLDEMDVTYFNKFKELLTRREIYDAIQSIKETSRGRNNPNMLLVLLQTLVNSNSVEIRTTCRYIWGSFISRNFGINIINLLSQAKSMISTQEEFSMYQILESYFYSSEIIEVLSTISRESSSHQNFLQLLLQTILKTCSNTQVQTAVNFFLNIFKKSETMNQVSRLITLLPPPTTEDEKVNFVVVKNFLQSSEAYSYVKDIDTTLFNDDKFLLELILKRIAESNTQVEISNAFKHYLAYTEKLASIDLITKKEIKKHFKLTEIFTDTLQLSSLSIAQKEAFRSFFKYISEIKDISDFTSWDQATTRGEFMKLLFQYFLKSETVPEEIKNCIAILQPLVRMDGRGALPP